jgi:hypothetical protein
LFRSAATGLDLNFAGGVFSLNNTRTDSPANIPGWSFSRTDTNGTATALDLAGNVIQFATGVPRITNRGILVEEARTNLLLRSQEFDNASWSKVNSTVTADAGTAPDGTTTADKIIPDATLNQHRVDQTPTSGAGAQTFSVFAKPNGYDFLALRIGSVGNSFSFNIATGAIIGGEAGVTAFSSPAGNGFYRVGITVTAASANDIARVNVLPSAAFVTFTGDGTSGVLLWGAQLELGAFATSPIITTGAAGTRGADSPIATGLAMLLNGTSPNTVIIDAEWSVRTDTRIYVEGYTGGTQSGATFQNGIGGTAPRLLNRTGATRTDNSGAAATISDGAISRFAIVSDGRLAAQGVILTSFNTPAQADWSGTLAIGHRYNAGTPQFSCCTYIRRVQILPYAATDAQLQALTAP